MEAPPPTFDNDGNKFFKDIQVQFDTSKQSDGVGCYVDMEEEATRMQKAAEEQIEVEEEFISVEPVAPRPSLTLFESIFNSNNDDEDDV